MQSTLQETLYRSQVTRCGTLAVDFTAEGHPPQTSGPVQMLGDHESNQPGWEAAAIMVGYSPLRGLRTFLSTPLSLSDPPFPNCYPKKASLGLLLTFCERFSGLERECCCHRVWHASEDSIVLSITNSALMPRATVSLEQTRPSIISRPWVYLSISGWQPPSRGTTASRPWAEKGTPAQKTTGKPADHGISPPEPQTKPQLAEGIRDSKIPSLGSSPLPWLGEDARWGYGQEPLLNSSRHCRRCC